MSSDASIESIDQRLKMKLAMVWREKSATIEDLRDKCRLLRRLEDVFPPGDWQVQIFSYNLAHEMADFLET